MVFLFKFRSFNFRPVITLVAIFATAIPIDLATKGTVLLALGFTSRT